MGEPCSILVVECFGGPFDGVVLHMLPSETEVEVYRNAETGAIAAKARGARPGPQYVLLGWYDRLNAEHAEWLRK